jgi:serine protease Do
MNALLLILTLSVVTPEELVNCNVYVESEKLEGSGVLFTHDNEAYVLTVAHVVAECKTNDVDVDVTYTADDVEIKVKAEILAYSDDENDDLALLHVKATGVFKQTVSFYDGPPPPIGAELYHVGNLTGKPGLNSLTTGIISYLDRNFKPVSTGTFDQITATIFPGSSGGGVYLKTGQLVGVVSRLRGPNFAAMVPIRRIRAWAKEEGVDYVFDPCEPTPATLEQP